MSDSTTIRVGSKKSVASIDLPTAATTKLLGGCIVDTNSGGFAVNGGDGVRSWGVATATADNTVTGAAPIVNVELSHPIWVRLFANDTGSPLTKADVGHQVTVLDNQTLTGDPTAGHPGAYVYEVTTEGVWAFFGSDTSSAADNITLDDEAGLYTATQLEAALLELKTLAAVRRVRGLVAGNVAALATFTVTGNAYDDGLTYVAGDRVLLAGQTTAAQNGVYVVGTVTTTTAPLTRATDMPAALALPNGSIVEVSEGTVWRGSSWKAMSTTTGGAVIGTNDPTFYPRRFAKVVTLSSGTYLIGAGGGGEQLFLYSTTTSDVQVTRNTAGGTLTSTTHYYAPAAGRIAGINPTAAVPVFASVAAGTVNAPDTSTVNVLVTNW